MFSTSKFFSKKIKFNKKCTSGCPEVLQAFPALEMFKVRLDRALSNLFQWKMSFPIVGVRTR